MNTIERLTSLFLKFPGIGTRQARRFVYFILAMPPEYTDELISSLRALKSEARQCSLCYRFFDPVRSRARDFVASPEDRSAATSNEVEEKAEKNICALCVDASGASTLIIVEKDIDVENIRKGGTYSGFYFVLGGLVSPLAKESCARIKELATRVREGIKEKKLEEVIIALGANPNGDYTTLYIKNMLAPFLEKNKITVTTLGRGISTGTELEYSDSETIKHALNNRR